MALVTSELSRNNDLSMGRYLTLSGWVIMSSWRVPIGGCMRRACVYLKLLFNFKENWDVSTNFNKTPQYEIS
jgi:hypothetical protein